MGREAAGRCASWHGSAHSRRHVDQTQESVVPSPQQIRHVEQVSQVGVMVRIGIRGVVQRGGVLRVLGVLWWRCQHGSRVGRQVVVVVSVHSMRGMHSMHSVPVPHRDHHHWPAGLWAQRQVWPVVQASAGGGP